jgi:hypothetical protein
MYEAPAHDLICIKAGAGRAARMGTCTRKHRKLLKFPPYRLHIRERLKSVELSGIFGDGWTVLDGLNVGLVPELLEMIKNECNYYPNNPTQYSHPFPIQIFLVVLNINKSIKF